MESSFQIIYKGSQKSLKFTYEDLSKDINKTDNETIHLLSLAAKVDSLSKKETCTNKIQLLPLPSSYIYTHYLTCIVAQINLKTHT